MNNRELSWLAFNERVLQEAQDINVPLMQRLRFLGIFSNNQDEFIKVRVANIIRMTKMKGKINTSKNTGGYTVANLLNLINESMDSSQKIFNQTYAAILAEMEKNGIAVINETQLSEAQKTFCRDYYSSVISVRLVPLLLRKTSDIPFLSDNNAYLAVKMSNNSSTLVRYAIIQIYVSKACPRFVELPTIGDKKEIIFSDDIIRLCLDEIFFMFKFDNISAHTFKILRDTQMTFDEDISKSLVEKMEESLEERLHGRPVRLIYDKEMPEDLLSLITFKLKIDRNEMLGGGRYHMFRDLMKFPKVAPHLEACQPASMLHPGINPFSSFIDVIKEKDIFLNYPYHTFNHLIDFLREAAIDPKVKSICITLYRTAENSKVINALVNAAKNGKQVVVLEELMARFDEEQNVENSDTLQKAGVTVIHGMKGLKVHSKIILVGRKEKNNIRGYVYVGTGNFNETTAQIYSDYGIFTANQQIASDAKAVFDFLLNTHKHVTCKNLLVSPYSMRTRFVSMIENEIANSKKGRKAYIYIKLNSLTDPKMIKLLYKASQYNVEVRLIVRGACCLQPQIKDLSENIKAISIVDQYLEHARMAIFCNDGNESIYIMSADWMTRNLDRRVEVGIPVYDKKIRKTLKDIFKIQWSDNVKARDLTIMGTNNYVKGSSVKKHRSQIELFNYYRENDNEM